MKTNTRKLTILALFAALAYSLVLFINIPIVPAPPINYDPKDVIIVIAGFLFGPLAVAGISLVTSLIEMFTVSVTLYWGLLMNVVGTCAFACPATVIYRRKRTIAGAVIGLVTGALFATGTMLLFNYIVTPLYMPVTREIIAGMLIPVFLPFNLLKTFLNVGFTLLLYKPVRLALSQARLLPAFEEEDSRRKISLGTAAAAIFVIATCVLLILAWRGII